MATDDLKIEGFTPNVPLRDWWDEYEGTRYTEASPEAKKKHLRSSSKRLLEEGYDWREVDAIVRNEARTREAIKLLQDSGARLVGDQWNLVGVNTPEKEEMFNRAMMITDNLDAIEGRTQFPEKGWDDHWLKRTGRWIDETAGDFGDWITDEYGARHDIPAAFDTIGDMEWDKIAANAVINTPEMLKDLSFFGPQLGWNVGRMLSGEEGVDPMEFLYNDPFFEYEEPSVAERGVEEVASAMGAIPLYRWLYNRAPEMAKKVSRNWMPFMHGVATDFGSDLKNYYRKAGTPIKLTKNRMAKAGNMLKNALWSPGTGRALGQTALTGGLGTFLSTLFYSPPLGAKEEYEGVYAQKPKFDFTYNPNANIITGIQDSNPVVFDNYMQNKLANFEPRTKDLGPRNNYQGL
jgi:hypothetical protein